MSASIAPFPASGSLTGRTAPVTEILGAGAHPPFSERTIVFRMMRYLAPVNAELVRFLTDREFSRRHAFAVDVVGGLADALREALDIEGARRTGWEGPAARDRADRDAQAIEQLLSALGRFQREVGRG